MIVFLGTVLGLIWYYVVPFRRGVALDNVSFAITGGDRAAAKKIVRLSFVRLGTAVLDALSCREPDRAVVVEGAGPVYEVLSQGRGLIAAVTHSGGIDMNDRVASMVMKLRLHVMTRTVSVGGFQRFFMEMRARRGNEYLKADTRMSELVRIVKAGGILALAYDQNMPPRHGIPVPFFGRDASTTYAPAAVAARTGAPAFAIMGYERADGAYVMRIAPPVRFESTGEFIADCTVMMEKLNMQLEEFLREHPEEWLWAHRRWKPIVRKAKR
jgi:KDO2-lipid IV(A) lauroyltransferase